MSEGHPLREILRGDLKERIDYVWMKAKEYHPFQKGDTLQATGHCEQVESNLYKLIPKDKNLSQISLFLLSAASCLHDIGKIESELPWAENHGDRSKQIILEDYERLGLDKGQAIAVAYIVGVHDHGHFDELPRGPFALGNESVRLDELACVFRLADMLDTTYMRAPEIVSDIKYEDVPPKWRGRQAITGWYLEGNRIILTAAPKKEDVEDVCTLLSMLKEELSEISPILSIYGYPHELELPSMNDIFIGPEMEKEAASYRPFPGMAFYTRDDAVIFKGREAEIGELLPIVL